MPKRRSDREHAVLARLKLSSERFAKALMRTSRSVSKQSMENIKCFSKGFEYGMVSER